MSYNGKEYVICEECGIKYQKWNKYNHKRSRNHKIFVYCKEKIMNHNTYQYLKK